MELKYVLKRNRLWNNEAFFNKNKNYDSIFLHMNTSGHLVLQKSSDSCLLANGGKGQGHLMDRKKPHGRLGFRDTPW